MVALLTSTFKTFNFIRFLFCLVLSILTYPSKCNNINDVNKEYVESMWQNSIYKTLRQQILQLLSTQSWISFDKQCLKYQNIEIPVIITQNRIDVGQNEVRGRHVWSVINCSMKHYSSLSRATRLLDYAAKVQQRQVSVLSVQIFQLQRGRFQCVQRINCSKLAPLL